MTYISAIGTAVPENRFSQSTIGSFMEKMMTGDTNSHRKIRAVFNSSGIVHRYSVLSDYGRTSEFTFYPNNGDEPFPGTKQRMDLYRREALPLSVAAIRDMQSSLKNPDLKKITHLVVVTCTGMYAPGLDIELVHELGLNTSVKRTCIYFMGCYAAFNALKVADAFCRAEENARVLIVCAELCSIHFQREATDDNILANALFADGAAALLVENEPKGKLNFCMEGFHTEISEEGANDMVWDVGDYGFTMKLSGYIPALISKGTNPVIEKLLENMEGGTRPKYFALHPGGKRILQTLEPLLGLSSEDNAAAYDVLANYGNMSSATIAFVLKELMRRMTVQDNDERVVAMAFGPGLTMESMLLQIHING